MSGVMRTLAELWQPVEAATPYGGQVVSYEALGVVWLRLGDVRARERTDGGVTRLVEGMQAVTRADPRLVEGRVLRFGGADWAVAAVEVEAGQAGWVMLRLERAR